MNQILELNNNADIIKRLINKEEDPVKTLIN